MFDLSPSLKALLWCFVYVHDQLEENPAVIVSHLFSRRVHVYIGWVSGVTSKESGSMQRKTQEKKWWLYLP